MKNLLSCLALTGFFVVAACHDDHGGTPVAVSVSGTVSGLSAAGLVLADGSHSATPGASATTFTLGGSYATGTAYAVTVQTQPANQVCSVANGSGTVGTADVTDVAVTCAAAGHHVGGTVSGLSAAGLVLANGTDTVTVTAGGTTFTLPASLSAGTAYAVTVQTQPTGQACSVANGSGTIAGTDVANVVVTCAAQAFALGGSVSGLTATGLVLANGSDTLTVAANATTFSMPTTVATGSSYSISVQTQPAGLACSVTHGNGTMPASAVTSVVLACSNAPFTLGGSVQGLTATGLVLANGSDALTVAANATTFTMPTPVTSGSAYALSIQTQPTGLACSFSTGGNAAPSSGTMPAGNVTSVALVCAPQSHTLGGSVSGLSSGTLVLANGADSVSVSADGSFQLPTPVAYGSTYTVTVQTQPASLTCTVGNATGTMSGSDVSNVSVVCAVNTYAVGGTVTGLTSTGLVLQNNGSDDTSVAANAAQFSMPTAVAYGATYNVTILTQPAGQTCTVTNGSGTVSADVTNVTIDCPHAVSFTSPGPASWTVPAGVTSITVTAYGAGGSAGGFGCCGHLVNGGSGALVTSTLTVQPGDSVTIYVGAGGAVAQEGGGGGGLTYVGDGPANFVIAGAGGGGGGGPGQGGAGGDAGNAGGNGGAGAGGGAGSNGVGGAAGGSAQTGPIVQTAGGAFTDTLTTGSGSGGVGGGYGPDGQGGAGISSGIGNGGDGGDGYGAGGGGGGYGGGGGGGFGSGGAYGSGGGGGGGSVGPAGTSIVVAPSGGPGAGGTNGSAGTDGSVTIAYP